ncbi:MAG: phosphotransferase [Burkholderiaceae bacterium]|jgi:aminoglycoside/choline kinase family phosphotransferase|nr:phosphotransferase [Burkholderiaceae bacterium]
MSAQPSSPPSRAPGPAPSGDAPRASAIQAADTLIWSDPERQQAFARWLASVAAAHRLAPDSVRLASADASWRRYLRVSSADAGGSGTTFIIMDAPPDKENCAPFVRVARLMAQAGLNVPRILAWDEASGFMLLTDLGTQTMLDAIDPGQPQQARPLYEQALDALLAWQRASRPGVLPAYDQTLLLREMALFPQWYLEQHRGLNLSDAQRSVLQQTFAQIVARNLAAPAVYVHRDFMPRNLMIAPAGGPLGVLDFQDALYGPASYDIASLLRDAFLSWDEEFVLDITIRYWEQARRAALMDHEDWHADFGSFWRAVEWMGLQRHLKVAGIFARLTLRDGKPRYLADTPRFIGYIRHTASRYRELKPLLRLIDEAEGTAPAPVGYAFGRVD